MLTGANQSIVTAYETLGMTPEQIAESEGWELLAVKAVLQQFCATYRKDAKGDPTLDFTDADLVDANQTILHLMHHSDDEFLRARMAKYVRDDKKGRKDIVNGLRQTNVNVVLFNQRLLAAREAKNKSKELVGAERSGALCETSERGDTKNIDSMKQLVAK